MDGWTDRAWWIDLDMLCSWEQRHNNYSAVPILNSGVGGEDNTEIRVHSTRGDVTNVYFSAPSAPALLNHSLVYGQSILFMEFILSCWF